VALAGRWSRGPRPFFIWFTPNNPHGEPHPPGYVRNPRPAPRHQGIYQFEPLPAKASFDEADVSDKPANLRDNPPVDVQEMNDHWQQRQEALMSVDEGVGRIVSQLRSSQVLGRTVIAFTSDNGFLLGEHRVLGKVLPYEESIRVPLLIRGPGFPAGLRVRQQASLADLVPTFLKTARGRATRPVDGAALQNLAANPRIWAGRPIVVEASPAPRELSAGAPMDRRNRSYVGIRTAANQLYVRYATGEREYYDMRTDPWQVRNLYGVPSAQAEIDRLDRLLTRYQNCRGVSCRRGS
jgi:arylsulfatase A-like enzyme